MGSQRTDFIRAVRRDAGDDPYLTGALYLLYEGDQDGLAYERWLKERQYTRTEELIFVMSLFHDTEQIVLHFKSQLARLLGAERTMPVFENTDIFQWVIGVLLPLKKLMKGKDTALLRALPALPVSFVKEGSKPYECLREHGYTPLEIAYANAMAVYGRWVYEGVRSKSLLAEKIVVALFYEVLGNEDSLPASVYEQLTAIFLVYSKFDIKCYEVRTLSDALNGACIKNPETMAWFIRRTSPLHPAASGFDITDPKWDSLAASLEPDSYKQLFEASLTENMDAGELQQRIGRYDELTGKSYLDFYWEGRGGRCFSLLVNAGVVDLWTAFQASVKPDGAAAKSDMLYHIGRYVYNIPTNQAFLFLKEFMPRYGYKGLNTYFSIFDDGFDRQLWKSASYPREMVILAFERDHLKDDPSGQLLLLHWTAEYFFYIRPQKYLSFVQAVLEDEAIAGLLPPEERRRLFELFISQKDVPSYTVSQLKQHYLTPEELKADQEAQDAARQAEERQRHSDMVRRIRAQYMDPANTTFMSVWKFLERQRSYGEDKIIAARTVHEGLEERIQKANGRLTRRDALYLLHICGKLIHLGILGWEEAQSYFLKIKEVTDDDPSVDPAG